MVYGVLFRYYGHVEGFNCTEYGTWANLWRTDLKISVIFMLIRLF